MKDYFVNVVSSLMIAASGWAFNRYALGDPGAVAAEPWSNLSVVVLIGSLMVMFRLNRLRGACVAAHSVDYKFSSETLVCKLGIMVQYHCPKGVAEAARCSIRGVVVVGNLK